MYKIVNNLVDIYINNKIDADVQNSQKPGRYRH